MHCDGSEVFGNAKFIYSLLVSHDTYVHFSEDEKEVKRS